MESRMKWLIPVLVLVGALSFWSGANAQQSTGVPGNQSAMARGAYTRYPIVRNLRRKKTRVLRLGCLDVKHREGCTASSGEFYLPVPCRIA